MADKIVGPNQGVAMSDGNGGTEGTSGNQQQGGGNSTPGAVTGTSGTSGTSGPGASTSSTSSGTSGTSDCPDCELVEGAVQAYLALSGLTLTYEALVELYVENKLGFGVDGKTLKKKYKEDNPDADPDQVDLLVDQQMQACIDSFNEDGSNAKIELQKKYDDLKSSMAEAKKSMGSLFKEAAKTVAEAAMPTTIGLGAPNPLSIALKLYNGVTKLKRILDAVFGATALFMTTAKALGLDGTDGYKDVMSAIASPLRDVQNLISKKESDADYQENLAMEDYLQNAKENWEWGANNNVSYEDVEDWGKTGFGLRTGSIKINLWPMEPNDRADVQEIYNIYLRDQEKNGASSSRRALIFKIEAILKYNDYLGWAKNQFKEYYQKLIEESNANNSTTDPGNTGGTGGTFDTTWNSNTYGLGGLDKKGTK